MRVPNNWKTFEDQTSVTFAPQGAYGDKGISHGALIGIAKTNSRSLADASEDYVKGILQSNNYLRQQTRFTQTSIDRRQAYTTTLSGLSPITGRTEIATVVTTQMRNGDLFYIVMVAPESESRNYKELSKIFSTRSI